MGSLASLIPSFSQQAFLYYLRGARLGAGAVAGTEAGLGLTLTELTAHLSSPSAEDLVLGSDIRPSAPGYALDWLSDLGQRHLAIPSVWGKSYIMELPPQEGPASSHVWLSL